MERSLWVHFRMKCVKMQEYRTSGICFSNFGFTVLPSYLVIWVN